MDEQTQIQDPITSLLTEFGTRLNEIEEKQRLVKDRVLLIGENLVASKEEVDKETIEIKKQLSQIDFEIKSIKQLNKRIISELNNFARKSEVEILERQFKMLEPLGAPRIKEIRKIVIEEINNLKK